MASPEYSVVIPCYSSGLWLESLVEEISNALGESTHEIILVNDHSPDEVTWPTIRDLAHRRENVIGIDLARNSGQFAALMCGLGEAIGDKVITMDDDFQHPPSEIRALIAGLDNDTDVVIGAYEHKSHGGFRNFGTSLMNRVFTSAYRKPRDLEMTSFRLIRRNVVETMLSFGTVRPVPGALILQSTAHITNVVVRHDPRETGRSGYSLRRLITSTLDNIVNASTGPLRLISGLGLISALLAGVALIFYLLRAVLTDRAVPGFSTTVLLITFFGGATLLAIGVLGEYVVRLVAEASDAPRYVIRERVGVLSAVRRQGLTSEALEESRRREHEGEHLTGEKGDRYP